LYREILCRVRIHGGLQVIDQQRLSVEAVQEAVFEIMDGAAQRSFENHDAADFAYDIPDVSRFRVNAFRHLNGIGAIFRAIPSSAMTLEELNMPKVIQELCRYTQGMILVTGKTGSGLDEQAHERPYPDD
jgi:twitching motility protein PilT